MGLVSGVTVFGNLSVLALEGMQARSEFL